MTFDFTFFIIIRRRAIIECALVIIAADILYPEHIVSGKSFTVLLLK